LPYEAADPRFIESIDGTQIHLRVDIENGSCGLPDRNNLNIEPHLYETPTAVVVGFTLKWTRNPGICGGRDRGGRLGHFDRTARAPTAAGYHRDAARLRVGNRVR